MLNIAATLVGPPANVMARERGVSDLTPSILKHYFRLSQALPTVRCGADDAWMTTPAERLAAELKRALTEAKISNSEIAKACGVTVQAVNGWLKTGRVGKQHLSTIARMTRRTIDGLLGETGGGVMLNEIELELVLSFRDLPKDMQADIRGKLMADAVKWREFSKEVLEKHGQSTPASNEAKQVAQTGAKPKRTGYSYKRPAARKKESHRQ
jgi:transcriptional regulator with XRE-family HTH domain